MRKNTGWALLGAGVAAVAGIGGYLVARERSVEQPSYRTRDKDKAIEIRDYPELLVAETTVTGAREQSLRQGFRRLASYIFAKDRDGDKIAMTAPVLSDNHDDSRRWRTRFIMPAKLRRGSVPPTDADVQFERIPARRVAAIRFNGKPTDELLRDKERELRSWLAMKGYIPVGPVEHAYYNSPMVPARLRRNEVLLPLRD
ncbi:SOUL family heme-binding protein [Stakelama marina]|uniref:Heme-binding protein n=1 Tax=Stakelama marina TaxID=2826939 RepID=A0A8T4IHY4_9SPHN|nr:heme-binding protein [Stakelama marina]MBR0551909.1 heme-binding protein [Stakelama marina]